MAVANSVVRTVIFNFCPTYVGLGLETNYIISWQGILSVFCIMPHVLNTKCNGLM